MASLRALAAVALAASAAVATPAHPPGAASRSGLVGVAAAAVAAAAPATDVSAAASPPGCSHSGLGYPPDLGGVILLEDVRRMAMDFYASGSPKLSDGAMAIVLAVLEQSDVVVQDCPQAVLQALILRMESLLMEVYARSSQSEDRQKASLRETADLQARLNALEAALGGGLSAGALDSAWPLARGVGRVSRYNTMLWSDVFESQDAWAEMEQPGSITDAQFHSALADVAQVLGDLQVEWWPCRGTLIALLRHGRRSGWLSRGILDNVERDIDVMLGVADEAKWHTVGRAIENGLKALGWARCWVKSSVSLDSELHDSARRDLLYCVRTRPAYVLLDVTSYIFSSAGPDVYVHGACSVGSGTTGAAGGTQHDADGCVIPAGVGPLRHAGGRLRKDAIRPLARCRADGLSIPCPREPLATIQAMIHSGLDAGCIALPNASGRDPEDPWTRRLQAEGLCSDDVRILRERSMRLDALGFQSMASYFERCAQLPEVMSRPC